MKCSFCNNVIEKGKGTIFVRKDGKLFEFCSSKCEKNLLKLRRNPLKVKWTNKE
jgi:large subunit ribosomal protein L24e